MRLLSIGWLGVLNNFIDFADDLSFIGLMDIRIYLNSEARYCNYFFGFGGGNVWFIDFWKILDRAEEFIGMVD